MDDRHVAQTENHEHTGSISNSVEWLPYRSKENSSREAFQLYPQFIFFLKIC